MYAYCPIQTEIFWDEIESVRENKTHIWHAYLRFSLFAVHINVVHF